MRSSWAPSPGGGEMAASVRIEAKAFDDPRFGILARHLGLADGLHALAKVARVWQWQAEEYSPDSPTYVVPTDILEHYLGTGAGEALVKSRLAYSEPTGSGGSVGYRMRGAEGRIEWLHAKRENGRKGGRPNKNKPTGFDSGSPGGTDSEPGSNPLSPSPLPAPVRTENTPLTPLKGGSPKRSRKPTHSDEQVDAAKRTLAHIAKRTGVQYQGAEPHVKLIAARLADPGVTEHDLRCVVAYCWDPSGLDWKNATTSDGVPMAKHLVPETLFGPKKLHKYLEPARAWYREHIAPKAHEATPEQSNQPVMLVASQIRSVQ